MSANDHTVLKGHIPPSMLPEPNEAGVDLLLTVWEDGTHEVALRPGHDATHRSWGPPVSLVAEMVGWMASSPEGYVAGDPR